MKTPDDLSQRPRSISVRFLRWLFSWKTLRRSLLALASLVTLVALLVTEENWRGKREWEKFKSEWEARGERFDLLSFMPKLVPDDQNFVMTPFFAPLLEAERDMAAGTRSNAFQVPESTLDVYGGKAGRGSHSFGGLRAGQLTDLQEWQAFYRANTNFPSAAQPQNPAKDVLLGLSKFAPVLTELRQASHRPYAVFPLYQDKDPMLPLIHLGNLKSISSVLRLRATAFLADGQSREALEDLKTCLRLADCLKSEPFLISHLVRLSILEVSINVIWEGLARHQWSQRDLMELQKLIGSTDLLKDYERAMRGEQAFSIAMLERMRSERNWLGRMLTFAVIYQNQTCIGRLYQLRLLPLADPELHRVYPERSGQLISAPEIKKATPYNLLARLLLPAIDKNVIRTARTQTMLDQAVAACALERFRLSGDQYPENLSALVPRFAEKLPSDVINGKPLHYHRSDNGQFVIYSVGWNEKDDGGTIASPKGKTPGANDEEGDWVWRYPVRK